MARHRGVRLLCRDDETHDGPIGEVTAVQRFGASDLDLFAAIFLVQRQHSPDTTEVDKAIAVLQHSIHEALRVGANLGGLREQCLVIVTSLFPGFHVVALGGLELCT